MRTESRASAARAPAWHEDVESATSVDGRTIEAYTLGEGPEVVMFIGAIHGDEPVGSGLIARLVEHLKLNRELLAGRRVVAVPVANPDGVARGRRLNDHGVDLNRNFPAKNFTAAVTRGSAPACEPESRFLADLIIRHKPARIVSIHQAMRCVNFDGPARRLAERMSEACGFVVAEDIGYRTPGSLGSWAGRDLAIPVITLEHTSSNDVLQAWIQHKDALLIAVRG